ncbi:MAG TPA: two-component regulator propeller domain-containing protein [Vicinamibacteria bacterium]|nr:two-component regulator propeller domain-containing protein [Vicinamibacteria bacterium]
MAVSGLVLATTLLAGGSATGSFSHVTVEDGLPHSYVRAILKDRAGFMWFATARGLVRYDGAHLVVYRHDPQDPASLPSGAPTCLLEDRERRLWVGTASGQWAGVGVLDRSTGRFTRYLADGRPGSLSAAYVQAIYEDRRGRLWVGHARGIDLFDPASKTFTAFPIGPAGEPRVMAMLEDSRGSFWVATERHGLFLFDRDTHAFRSFPIAGAGFFAAFLEQPAGTLWVAGYGAGLVRIDLASGRARRYLPDPQRPDSLSVAQVVQLAGDGDRHVYVGTENGGLDVLDVSQERFTHYRPDPADPRSLGSASIWALYRDDHGLLWAGANGFGVSWLAPLAQRFEAIRAGATGLGDPHVTSIAEGEDGRIWVGTDGGGLHVLDPRTAHVSRYPLPAGGPGSASNAVQSVLADAGGRVWVGFWSRGLCRIDTRSGAVRFYHPPAGRRSPMSDSVWRVLDAGGGELLVATNDGAFLFDERRESYQPLSDRWPGAGLGSVWAADRDGSGGLWLAHMTSVEHVDRRKGTVRHFFGDDQGGGAFAGSFVDALHADSRGRLWVGTERGLTCLDSDGRRLASYAEKDGLPNPNVESITEDASGNIWVGTYGGLARLRGAVAAPAGAAVLAFDERDGVSGRFSMRSAAFRARDGELYFGTSSGLTRFLPEGFQTNGRVPSVVLTGLRLGGRPVVAGRPGSPLTGAIEETSELVLPHDQADVTFTFAALNYVLPQKNRYTHRLEGLDREWSPVGPETQASYVRIPPGEYVFRVRACNNDGVWNLEGVRLRLRVTPPFWQTGWFAAALALSLLGAGVVLHASRLRRVRQRFQVVLDERRRLSRELHDTLEQGLAGIALQVDSARQHLQRRPEVVEGCLETALRMVEYSREETRRTVNQLRSQALEQGDIAQAVREVAGELTSGGEPTVVVEVRGAPRRLSAAAEHHLFRIAQEALTNAVTHAHASRVSVLLVFDGDAVELTVFDDGRGLPGKPGHGFHFGFSGMRERARALGTRLEVESAPGKGTTVRVRWTGAADPGDGGAPEA